MIPMTKETLRHPTTHNHVKALPHREYNTQTIIHKHYNNTLCKYSDGHATQTNMNKGDCKHGMCHTWPLVRPDRISPQHRGQQETSINMNIDNGNMEPTSATIKQHPIMSSTSCCRFQSFPATPSNIQRERFNLSVVPTHREHRERATAWTWEADNRHQGQQRGRTSDKASGTAKVHARNPHVKTIT